MDLVPYFAYGTTRRGFEHHRQLAHLLGEPIARVRTASPHAVVVPCRAACGNPGCPHVHRMAALVSWVEPLHAEGDLFLVPNSGVAALDRLETGSGRADGPYVRAAVDVVSPGGERCPAALAYVAREPARWRALVEVGEAEALAAYPAELARALRPKDCCVRAPGHAPPHEVVDPLAAVAAR